MGLNALMHRMRVSLSAVARGTDTEAIEQGYLRVSEDPRISRERTRKVSGRLSHNSTGDGVTVHGGRKEVNHGFIGRASI